MNISSEKFAAIRPHKILMIDDEFLGRVMQKQAASDGFNLECFSSLENLGRVAFFSNFNLILLGYWIDDFNET